MPAILGLESAKCRLRDCLKVRSRGLDTPASRAGRFDCLPSLPSCRWCRVNEHADTDSAGDGVVEREDALADDRPGRGHSVFANAAVLVKRPSRNRRPPRVCQFGEVGREPIQIAVLRKITIGGRDALVVRQVAIRGDDQPTDRAADPLGKRRLARTDRACDPDDRTRQAREPQPLDDGVASVVETADTQRNPVGGAHRRNRT